jgi:hypothetical protein
MLNTNFLYASLLWGTIGAGYCIYGKKQHEAIPLIAGLLLVAFSFLIFSALWMSLASIAVIVATTWLIKKGY